MNFEKFDVVEVNNNNFIILNIITYNDSTFLYLINEDEEDDSCAIVKVENCPEGIKFTEATSEEQEIVTSKLIVENKDEIKEILENYE